jgi:hypothetical protein
MKLHLCCGTVYLDGYLNLDIYGALAKDIPDNPNKTTIDKYFKDPFEPDPTKRKKKVFIIDQHFDILGIWPFDGNTVEEIVMVSAIEHFEHRDEVPYIISEAHRVLKFGGIFKFDFPNIYQQVLEYYRSNPEFMMELIYCNHKDKYSVHKWGYTPDTLHKYLSPTKWACI